MSDDDWHPGAALHESCNGPFASVVLTDRYASNRSSLRYGDESPSILVSCLTIPNGGSPQPALACRRSVKLSQPWGQRNAYAPQKGIEVEALGALSAAHIGINMVKPG